MTREANNAHCRGTMKRFVKGFFRSIGLDVRRAQNAPGFILPVEFSKSDAEVFRFVTENNLTMVSAEGVVATISACKHAVLAGIRGDFVECGVWRGGNAIAAKMTFEAYGSDKEVWLFDTFAGMSQPGELDRAAFTAHDPSEIFVENQRDDYNEWCYASIEDVRGNFKRAGVDLERVRFIKGDVLMTLSEKANLPHSISVLRLDTDFYESTKTELEALYPRLSRGGSLLIDDFGYWEGVKTAVGEYFSNRPPSEQPLLHYTDFSGRMGVKP